MTYTIWHMLYGIYCIQLRKHCFYWEDRYLGSKFPHPWACHCPFQWFIVAQVRSTAPEQSAVAAIHASPTLISSCPSVAHPNSSRAPKGPGIPPQIYLPFTLVSISLDMLHEALKPQRKWSVIFVSRSVWSGVLMPQQLETHAKSLHPFYFCVLIVGVWLHCGWFCWWWCQSLGIQSTAEWTPIRSAYEKFLLLLPKMLLI